MANQSSPSSIYCASFNQDNSGFAISSRDSFKIFDSTTGRLCYERAAGAFVIVEMLYSSDLLALVGAGEQASLSPRRLCLFNTTRGSPLKELNFLTSILAVRMNKKRLVVVLVEKTFVYDLNTLVMLDTIDTVPNPKVELIRNLEGCFLAVPASTTKGAVLVYNVIDLQSHSEIDAHRSPLAAIALSSNGMYIATASEQGTLIRVHLVSESTKSYTTGYIDCDEFFRLHPCLSLMLAINQRSKRSTSFLGSVLPDSVSDALDPAHHHVLQNAVPSELEVVRKIEKLEGTSSPSQFTSIRATVSVITYSGYFQEYTLSINSKNESLWTLEREFNSTP
ncbi:hypothetical protein Rs2_12988 [Raphanus sativus]|nr:hypothetical protein Rs2_12988 [Raphanus sativus]